MHQARQGGRRKAAVRSSGKAGGWGGTTSRNAPKLAETTAGVCPARAGTGVSEQESEPLGTHAEVAGPSGAQAPSSMQHTTFQASRTTFPEASRQRAGDTSIRSGTSRAPQKELHRVNARHLPCFFKTTPARARTARLWILTPGQTAAFPGAAAMGLTTGSKRPCSNLPRAFKEEGKRPPQLLREVLA